MLTFDAESHTYRWKGEVVPNVTRILRPILPDYGVVDADVLERARQEGVAIHRMVDLYMAGKLDLAALHADEAQAWLLPRFRALERFIDDTGFSCFVSEQPIYHRDLRYAGTPDLIGIMPKAGAAAGWSCIDVKRSFFGGASIGVQVAAYVRAWNAGDSARRDKALRVPEANRFALQLRPDGTYRLEPFTDGDDYAVFLSLLTIHHYQEKHRGRQ